MIRKPLIRKPKTMLLNISSLMDILTILLIFLIFSFDTESEQISPPKGFELPESTSELPPKQTIQIQISKNNISIGDKLLTTFIKGNLNLQDVDNKGYIIPLLEELKYYKSQWENTKLSDIQKKEKEIIYFQADKKTPFGLIRQVMKTTDFVGFKKFRLAVIKH